MDTPTPTPTPTRETDDDANFRRRASAWALPTVLAICAYLAQSNYSQIKAQLDRIESRQQSDIVTIAELKLRVLRLEQLTGNNAPPQASTQPPEVLHP